MTTDELKRHQDNLEAYSHWVKDPENNIVDIEWKSNETSLSRWEGCRKGHVPLWNFNRWDYRLKPQPRVIPWTRETVKRDAWLRFKGSTTDWPIRGISDDSISVNATWLTYEDALERLIQHDGSPAGTVEEVRE